MSTLSVTIITKNEAHTIRRALESVKWADEIIVLDSGSTDATLDICREYTAHVFTTDWPGFGIQKNRALAKASNEWVLSIDADEEISELLATEIREAIGGRSNCNGFCIKRISNYCGRFIRYGDWSSDHPLRLFKKSRATFTDDSIHERVIVQGKVGLLKQTMLHFPFQNLEQVLNKINFYSSKTAELQFSKHKKSSVTKAMTHASWCFIRGYFFRRGFLDGKEGFLLALSNALGTFYRYTKLLYLNLNTNKET